MSPSRTRMTRARARQTSLSRGPAPVRLSPPARLLGQRRLTDARPALDDQHPAAACQQQLNRGQLTLALAQPPHQTSLPLPPCPVHRAAWGWGTRAVIRTVSGLAGWGITPQGPAGAGWG